MTDFAGLEKTLRGRGFRVTSVRNSREAKEYLDSAIDGATVGIGGSATVRQTGVYELLRAHNTVFWHWEQPVQTARRLAMDTEVYLTSVNAVAKSGELVCIDTVGNRAASLLFGHKKIYFLIGRNKITKTYEEAVWRARNIAAPQRAKQVNAQTVCAARGDRCYNCGSPACVCRGMVTLFYPMQGQEAEIILIDEDLGL